MKKPRLVNGYAMRKFFLALTLLSLLTVMSPRDLQAQANEYPDWEALQYQEYLEYQQYLQDLRERDPYYDLHSMHQRYRPQYQSLPIYPPCCYVIGVIILDQSLPITPPPQLLPSSQYKAGFKSLPRAGSVPLAPGIMPQLPQPIRRR
jgi:hypothetical protein